MIPTGDLMGGSSTDDDAEDNPLGADHTIGTGNSVLEDPMQPAADLGETMDNDDDANDGSFADPNTYFAGGSDADNDGENETTVGGNEVVDSNDPVEALSGNTDSDQQDTDATPSNDPTQTNTTTENVQGQFATLLDALPVGGQGQTDSGGSGILDSPAVLAAGALAGAAVLFGGGS